MTRSLTNCRKQRHKTYRQAEKHLCWLARTHIQYKGKVLSVYWCEGCKAYHVGNTRI